MKKLFAFTALIILTGCRPSPVGPTIHDTLVILDTVCIVPPDTLVNITAAVLINFRTEQARLSAGGEWSSIIIFDVWPGNDTTFAVKKGSVVVVNWYKDLSVLPADIIHRDTLTAVRDTILR